jgi:hypothetical protein
METRWFGITVSRIVDEDLAVLSGSKKFKRCYMHSPHHRLKKFASQDDEVFNSICDLIKEIVFLAKSYLLTSYDHIATGRV